MEPLHKENVPKVAEAPRKCGEEEGVSSGLCGAPGSGLLSASPGPDLGRCEQGSREPSQGVREAGPREQPAWGGEAVGGNPE